MMCPLMDYYGWLVSVTQGRHFEPSRGGTERNGKLVTSGARIENLVRFIADELNTIATNYAELRTCE